MAIKVVHITEAWVGGIATYVDTLIDYQSKAEKFDEISLIYASNKTDDNIEDEFANYSNVTLYPYESSRNPLKFFQISRKINDILLDIKPDIVHLHSTFPGVYGRINKKFPTVYCPHCWSFVQDIGVIKKYIYINIEKFLAKKTDAIVNISRSESSAAKKFGVHGKLNSIILNGVEDIRESTPKPNLKIDENCINIGFIGRLDHQKGFDIIEPFFRTYSPPAIPPQTMVGGKAEPLTSHPNPLPEGEGAKVKLYVIGDFERGRKKDYPTCENITYLGWVDSDKIDSYIKLFDAVIMPSRYEGFGLVAVEAMRNKKAVIVSDRGALPELVMNGYNGYVFDLDNAEENLTDIAGKLNKESLAKMGENAREVYLSNFTADRFAGEIEELYAKVLKP